MRHGRSETWLNHETYRWIDRAARIVETKNAYRILVGEKSIGN
jgi:hypothetical protein